MNPKSDNKLPVEKMLEEEQKLRLRKEIGTRIRRVRKALGYTQDKMVDFFNCCRANYSRIEKGEVFPNPTMLQVLNNQFNVSLRWLICNKGPMLEKQKKKETSCGVKIDCREEAEIEELFLYMDSVPMVKHAVLCFFLEYIGKNKRLIEPLMKHKRVKK